jgi:magnesium-transporting ATPase (P-type)
VLYVKGAPEIVMGKCNLEESRVKQYNEQLLAYQNQAMRTLGVAYKVIPACKMVKWCFIFAKAQKKQLRNS